MNVQPTRTIDASKLREAVGGTFFAINFIKRSNGQERKMLCRLGVKKDRIDGQPRYDPAMHSLIFVYDIQNQAYRSIPLDSVVGPIRARGQLI